MLPLLFLALCGGIAAEDKQTTHYRLKQDSLCLQVNMSAESDDTWSFNGEVIVYKKKVAQTFVDKVDYHPQNLSLCINKLTEEDGGIYTTDVVHEGKTIQKKTFTHRLEVQGAVPTPVLIISPTFPNQSAELCNMTKISVNCSARDEWQMSTCDQERCTVIQESLQQYNITVVAANKSVICIGSNQVSTSNVSASTDWCESHLEKSQPQIPEPSISSLTELKLGIGLSILALIIVIITLIFIVRKRTKDPAGVTQPEEPPGPLAGVPGSSSICGPDATAAQTSRRSSQSPGSGHGQSSGVDTIYSVLGEKYPRGQERTNSEWIARQSE